MRPTADEIAEFLGCSDLEDGQSRKISAPYRDDLNPSLNVTRKEGKFFYYDHGAPGDTPGATFDALVEYFGSGNNGQRHDSPSIKVKSGGGLEETYPYVDADDSPLFEVCRYSDKQFKQRRRVGSRWVYSLGDTKRVLYRWPELIAAVERAETVYLVEGEKDADRLVEEGFAATTNPGGAGKWRDEFAEALRGANVVVVADRDAPGEKHARQVKRSLIGVARSVRVVEALTGKDLSDHLDAGHSLDQLVPADRFQRVDLGVLIEEGIPPPDLLVDDVFYSGRSHALMGEPGDGKTLVMLFFAAAVTRSGGMVAWFDEENGPIVVASRLEALGATPAEVSERFAYYPYTEPTLDDADELAEEMAALMPDLVVFDSGADMYASAGLDENNNMDMTLWAQKFSQRLSRGLDIASVVLEHVTKKGDDGYQRGAGAKKAKVDVSWRLEVVAPFDHETIGEVELVRKKDRLAHLPPLLRYRIGGDGKGNTIFERVPVEDEQQEIATEVKRKRDFFCREAITVLRDNGALTKEDGLTQRTLTGLLSPAEQRFKNELVQQVAKDPSTPVHSARGKYNSIVYWLEEGSSDE